MPRRLIQRAFLKWFEINRSRFVIEIKLGRRTDRILEFSFVGINSVLTATLTTYEISIYVHYEDYFWDIILDLDAEPKRVADGYVCDLCPPESRPVFPNRSALWTDHLFEPFLAWVNKDLAEAIWLVLEGRKDQMTRATLSKTPPDPESGLKWSFVLVPVRENCPRPFTIL